MKIIVTSGGGRHTRPAFGLTPREVATGMLEGSVLVALMTSVYFFACYVR